MPIGFITKWSKYIRARIDVAIMAYSQKVVICVGNCPFKRYYITKKEFKKADFF